MTFDRILQALALTPERKGTHLLSLSLEKDNFSRVISQLVHEYGLGLSLLFATDDRKKTHAFGLHAVLSHPHELKWLHISTVIPEENPSYESLTKTVMAAHWYERYIHDMFGILPEGHPYLQPLVLHENFPEAIHPLRKDFLWDTIPEKMETVPTMARVEGDGLCEISVGPIHAGIIEPGHFRFHVLGERVIALEGKLFYTHKGVEKILEGKTIEQAMPFIERVSGDMAASHSLAFCQAVEAIANTPVPYAAKVLRTIVCELERITMHIHDLSNIAGMGTGFSVMAANGFRIKERMMRLSQEIFGNRFWREFIVPGGVTRVLYTPEKERILEVLEKAVTEMMSLVNMALQSHSLCERLEGTGVLTKSAAIAYGAVGLPARASGVDRDIRRDMPYAGYEDMEYRVVVQKDGDVNARFLSRIAEIEESHKIILESFQKLEGHKKEVLVPVNPSNGEAFGAVESWRGEIFDFVRVTNGVIDRVVIRDPSFCNWALFGELTPGNIIPDFPLCNKSLNLSYSGTDV
ncbi:MAG: NADH-quinone oxidoreductase subunit C [Candidatus Peregrinibacteria bacterium]